MSDRKNSKFLSLILRHQPEKIGLRLDKEGYGDVTAILKGTGLTFEELEIIVETNDKKRFAFNKDKTKLRATQGHSIDVDLKLKPVNPTFVLYHGTSTDALNSIFKTGLNKAKRHHVHLAKDKSTSTIVGLRKGSSVLLEVDAPRMIKDGYKFFISENGVYLTDFVPAKYLKYAKMEN